MSTKIAFLLTAKNSLRSRSFFKTDFMISAESALEYSSELDILCSFKCRLNNLYLNDPFQRLKIKIALDRAQLLFKL